MNCETNGKCCQLCENKIARPEAICGCVYLCDDCATAQIVIDDSETTPTKKCNGWKCDNEPVDMGSWAGSEYCQQCFYVAERNADAMRGERQLNKSLGLNDSGTMTATIASDGLTDHGRNDL